MATNSKAVASKDFCPHQDDTRKPLLFSNQKKRHRCLQLSLISCLFLFAAFVARESSSTVPSRLDQTVPSLSKQWTCEQIYTMDIDTNFCARKDALMCEKNCAPNSWCYFLCGETCGISVGALCIFHHLSNVSNTCAIVQATDRNFLPTQNGNTQEIYDSRDLACDYYAWCTHCRNDCPDIIEKPIFPLTSAGQAAYRLNSIESLCSYSSISPE